MAGYTAPLPARSGGLQFSRLSPEEIRKISVLRINASPALDSMLGPVPRGLYDPAMGAVPALDMACSTCKLMGSQCQGHCGHIDLPVPCYHPQFIDTTLRLLRAKCVYCHRLRVPSLHINKTSCELRLLQYGLINAYFEFQEIHAGSKRHRAQEEDAADEEEDAGDLMARRSRFVEQKIKEAARAEDSDPTAFTRNPTAASARRRVVAEFIQRASTDKKCAHCRGISPPYRKDRAVKFFKKPLSTKSRETMRVQGMKAPNPLLVLRAQQRRKEEIRKPMSSGIQKEDAEVEEAIHGAEDEIAAQDALDEAEGNLEIDDNEEVQTYMTTDEVFAALTLLFEREQEIFRLLFSKGRKTSVTADMFFIRAILVPPNRFRPPARQGADRIVEATQNGPLNRIIKAVSEVRRAVRTFNAAEDAEDRGRAFSRKVALAVTLQESVNGLIDQPTSTAARQAEPGIKQVFEKKEGLFRMHMMGKRVNHAARSVISPDPNIETNEIGVPLVFAKRLTFPEPVTKHNFEELKRAVMNGMDKYPGASAIEDEAGRVMSLKRKNPDQRRALAMQLLTTTIPGARGDQTKKVWRHLLSGDFVIMNRQPTLHKPSMMGHRAKVLTNQKTIRMHYANCNTYNADFDGDEMNMHFPQNELARAEASQIADTDNQYLSATAGKPLRGLIQDHISMAVQFTSRDTYFDRDQYQEMIYSCLRPEDNHTIFERIQMVPPALVKPKMLWTGKQVITTVLKNIIPIQFEGMNLTSKSSTASDSWSEITVNDPGQFRVTREKTFFRDTEQIVIFKHGEYLCGILDKGQIGPAAGGFIHSVHELYGHIIAGKLLSILGRLLTRFLNERAWSCGMDDLYLTNEGDNNRRAELSKSKRLGREVAAEYVSLTPNQAEHDPSALSGRLEGVLRDDDQLNGLDQVYKSKVKAITDSISKLCMPAGLRKSFPRNQMQAMTISGAKGSSVNANLISCNLGQQVLEGRRVPLMVSGKSLPSFAPFETDPGAGGYVKGRFLTGIKPHEYFFHAMSGREGLIDTAVKTAKSGYLQRCVIKGLEGAKAEYDSSVRECSNGTVIQFLYGEDGLEVAKQRHLKEFSFLISNINTVGTRLRLMELAPRLKKRDAGAEQKAVIKSLRKNPSLDPVLATRPPATWFGSTSETFAGDLQKYIKDNPDHLIKDKAHTEAIINKKTVQSVMDLKYMRSLVEAGEAIGVVAAQSVGEPSTQMTLNTFHLAGHSAKNVTLGIPRLREIVMTATSKIMTPTMTIRPIEELTFEEGQNFAKGITKLPLTHMISELKLKERNDTGEVYEHGRVYDVTIQFFDREEYQEEYHIKTEDVRKAVIHKFLPRLFITIKNLLKKKIKEAERSEATAAVPELGVSVGRVEEQRAQGARREREGGEDVIDEEADPESAKDTAGRERAEDNYDEPDDDDQRIEDAPDTKDDDDDEDNEEDAAAKKAKKAKEAAEAAETAAEDSGYESESLAPKTEEEKEELAIIQELNPQVAAFNFDREGNNPTRILLKYPTKTPKLLLLPILESCLHQSVVHSIPGLNTCTLFMEDVVDSAGKKVRILNHDNSQEEDKKEPVITTEGVNLLAMRDYQHVINPHTIYTNSVHDMLNSYGIEAARAVIIREISTVFAGHGISVDNRHINLIADAMTQTGRYLAFSRNGIVKESSSVLARMSFESGMVVLKDAVLEEARDDLKGVSAGIVAGRRGGVGTGGVDIVLPVS